MAEVDTSSYLKPTAQPSLLDTVGKFQGLEAQRLGIDQNKLKLMSEHMAIAVQEMSQIANDPAPTQEKAKARLDNLAKITNMPAPVYQRMMGEFQGVGTDPNAIREWGKSQVVRGMNTEQMLHKVYGVNGFTNDGQNITPTLTKTGEGPVPSGPPIAVQPPPTTPVIGADNRPGLLGAQSPQLPPGAVPAPGGLPGQFIPQNRLPVALPAMPPPNASAAPPPVLDKPQDRVAQGIVGAPPGTFQPRGPVTGYSPMFDQGKADLQKDQELATQKLTAIKPAIQALPLMKDILTGPIGEKFTKAVSALKGVGFLPIEAKGDPTAQRQEVVKKLAQYLSTNPVGQRSDAAQVLAEAGSPNPNVQVLPALVKLTKDSIILDRVQAARAGAFEGEDYSKYGTHRAQFPASVDERAFGLDLMEPEERRSLINEMKKKQNTFEGKKFWKSLAIVDKQGLIDTAE